MTRPQPAVAIASPVPGVLAATAAAPARLWRWLVILFAILFIAGCAVSTRARGQKDLYSSSWHGRLALSVAADPPAFGAASQSFSSAFELQGNAQHGSLLLLTPLGSTAASVLWTPASATLHSGGERREFPSLQALILHLLGTAVPADALFAWLDGQPVALDGWQVDLSQRSAGRIIAHRVFPAPEAELRLILEP